MKTFPRCNALLLALVVLSGSPFGLAHNPNPSDSDPVAAAQWKPGAPQVQLEGQLQIVHQDFKDGHGKFVYTLKQADGTRVPLHFVKNPPTHALTGDHVTVSGQQSSSGLILYSGGTNVKNTSGSGSTTPSIPVPYTFGTQQVLVILVNFQDDVVQPYTVADAQSAFFGDPNNFFMENSYQQTSLSGTVVGWYTIPDSVTTCNINQIATDSQSAAMAAGVNLSNYTRYVYAFPPDNACGFAGASEVGGNPSQSWIDENVLEQHVINHELGHAFGLWHSHSLYCGTSATIGSNCSIGEYGDIVDVMGAAAPRSPHFNAFQKERLGWLNYGSSPSIQTVTTSGTYTIYPYEPGGPGPKALKVLKGTDPTTGAKMWYYLEARQAVGFDAFLTDGTCAQCYTQNETTGVLFHIGTDGDGNSSDLIDMTPATPLSGWWFDPSLVVGQSFADSSAGVTFTPTAVDSTGATVQITMNNGPVCTAANPTVSISPSQSPNVASGTPVNFTATVTDNDSSSCAPATFNLSGTVPAGWAGILSTGALSLSPGKSGSATLSVTSPVGTVDGSYNVAMIATNASASSYSGSAAATYVINTAPLSIGVTANPSATLPGQTVLVTVTASSGTSPATGTNVAVAITTPNGRTQTMTGTTGSNGAVSFAYSLSKHAAVGTYPVQANLGSSTTKNAAATVGASTTFTVQ